MFLLLLKVTFKNHYKVLCLLYRVVIMLACVMLCAIINTYRAYKYRNYIMYNNLLKVFDKIIEIQCTIEF